MASEVETSGNAWAESIFLDFLSGGSEEVRESLNYY